MKYIILIVILLFPACASNFKVECNLNDVIKGYCKKPIFRNVK